ncbi:DUF1049 domain-containing protein [Leptolyngbya sp. FACHB-36]|uniref:DUF1049 domain-containing protein n=1 Tax=Leptolyngbya sp. FACHB-36 TaxID=2692808 RepID=UPI0016803DC8|nr:DUF1049 domain-containing protein [Leptolyngbya sp. FACHB-36]MBD2020867.1 DUF1049 domain-containing protein [Leptolyngbya sp. FACHB-36]
MKILATVLTSLLVAFWIGVISIIVIQNFTPVALKFLVFQSIDIPVGIVLAFSVGAGIVGTAIVQPLLVDVSSGTEDDE